MYLSRIKAPFTHHFSSSTTTLNRPNAFIPHELRLRLRLRLRDPKMAEAAFVETRLPQQKTVDGFPFPSVLCANPALEFDLFRFTDAIKQQKPRLEHRLRSSGAVLFRDFPVQTASDFNRAVEAFGYDELPYVGGAAPRTNVVGRVFTANESPPDQKIPFHHEMAQVPEFPLKLFFFCEEEPQSGGETPIVLSHRVYERMRESYPDFVERLEKHGLIYTRILGAGDDPSSPIGRGWQSTFLTNDKAIAEESEGPNSCLLELDINWYVISKKKRGKVTIPRDESKHLLFLCGNSNIVPHPCLMQRNKSSEGDLLEEFWPTDQWTMLLSVH